MLPGYTGFCDPDLGSKSAYVRRRSWRTLWIICLAFGARSWWVWVWVTENAETKPKSLAYSFYLLIYSEKAQQLVDSTWSSETIFEAVDCGWLKLNLSKCSEKKMNTTLNGSLYIWNSATNVKRKAQQNRCEHPNLSTHGLSPFPKCSPNSDSNSPTTPRTFFGILRRSISQDISGNQYGQEMDPDEILPPVSLGQRRMKGKVRPAWGNWNGPITGPSIPWASILQCNAQRIAGTKQNQMELTDT